MRKNNNTENIDKNFEERNKNKQKKNKSDISNFNR